MSEKIKAGIIGIGGISKIFWKANKDKAASGSILQMNRCRFYSPFSVSPLAGCSRQEKDLTTKFRV